MSDFSQLHQSARKRLSQQNFGSHRLESWRRTPVSRLQQFDFANPQSHAVSVKSPIQMNITQPCIYFNNGRWNMDHAGEFKQFVSSAIENTHGTGLLDAIWGLEEITPSMRSEKTSGSMLACINLACLEDWLYLDIPDGYSSDKVLYIIHQMEGDAHRAGSMLGTRLLMRLGYGANIQIIEQQGNSDQDDTLHKRQSSMLSGIAEFELSAEAQMRHLLIQDCNIASSILSARRYRLGAGSKLELAALTSGGDLQRLETQVIFDQPDSQCNLSSLCMLNKNSHLDHITWFDHVCGNTTSSQVFRGVLHDHATACAQGKIAISKDADKTDARQNARAMLLSDQARIDMKPELDILAHDVACAHGVTLSNLDADMLYYIKNRAIGPDLARKLLLEGFMNTAINTQSFSDEMSQLLQMQLSHLLESYSW